MKISRDQVVYVAHLARLSLPEEQIEMYQGQLDKILEYIDRLNRVDTSNIEPTSHVMAITNVFREDKVKDSLPAEEVLSNAPQKESSSFCVPKVIE
ncbi:MAG: Asp-tRNA(Asn)/Glu-tRNA(Gln) amidotransferase subunit GatC [Deltaproteobacteria bacterium]|nr:Asp-tRNA(Asn)/Glu-tRNA(Gln) amidotransferase subunit GatC [Deltaproteobacteria bacterium]